MCRKISGHQDVRRPCAVHIAVLTANPSLGDSSSSSNSVSEYAPPVSRSSFLLARCFDEPSELGLPTMCERGTGASGDIEQFLT